MNVGGITIRSADLAALFRDTLGFAEVRTFLASGNVRFETDAATGARAALKSSIEKALRERFGYDAWIVLVTLAELERAIAKFPFDDADAARQPWVVFCVDTATRDELAEAAASVDAHRRSGRDRTRRRVLEPAQGLVDRHRRSRRSSPRPPTSPARPTATCARWSRSPR